MKQMANYKLSHLHQQARRPCDYHLDASRQGNTESPVILESIQ